MKFPGINLGHLDIPEVVASFLSTLRSIDTKLDALIALQEEANSGATLERLARATRERQAYDARRPDTNGWCVPCSAAGMCDLSPQCGRAAGPVPGLDVEQLAALRRKLEGSDTGIGTADPHGDINGGLT